MKKQPILLLIISLLFLAVSCKKAKTDVDAFNAIIIEVSGSVSLNGAPAKKEMIIKAGDVIETGINSSCQFLIKNKNIFAIKENSKLTYNISLTKNELKLSKGWFAGVSKEKFTNTGTFVISTPTAVAGIRGTSMCIKVEDPKSSYMCVCNGVINLKGQGSPSGEDVEASHHKAKRFKLDASGNTVSENAPMLYHDDETINLLAKKIGVTINW